MTERPGNLGFLNHTGLGTLFAINFSHSVLWRGWQIAIALIAKSLRDDDVKFYVSPDGKVEILLDEKIW